MSLAFEILDERIEIPIEMQNAFKLMIFMMPSQIDANEKFEKWYKAQGDAHSVIKNHADIIYDLLLPIAERAVDFLSQQNIYSIDSKYLMTHLTNDIFDGFSDTIEDMADELGDIDNNLRESAEYRRMRKATRGRVVGGGFGMSGALKGMMQAGMINATTGAFHSVGNMIGNAGSSISASIDKSTVYSKYKPILLDKMGDVITYFHQNIVDLIESKTTLRFDYVMDKGLEPDSETARSILQNYKQNRIPEQHQKEQLIIALRNDPGSLDIYETIWTDYGDENGDLRKMAHFFWVPLNEKIVELANNHCDEIFMTYCKEYETSKNPIYVAIKIEDKIKTARDEILSYCNQQEVEIDAIPSYQKCVDILAKVEEEARVVNGILYENKKEADKIRADRKQFYSFLKNKNLQIPSVYEELSKIEFQSDDYKNHLRSIYEKEIILRDPTRIIVNLFEIMQKYFPSGSTALGPIDFARTDYSLEQKEKMIREVTLMQGNEIPIMLVNYSSNGKQGILVTNCALRNYGKGLLSSVNNCAAYDEYLGIECLGDNQISVQTVKGSVPFSVKSGLSLADQNKLCAFLEEVVLTVTNLPSCDRINLQNIYSDSVKCVCGTYLPRGKNICPNCFKIRKEDGTFVDSVPCKYCGNLIQPGKKFCNKCGKPQGEASHFSEQNTLMIPSAEVITERKASFCPKCGNRLNAESKFCGRCGAKIR